MGVVYKAEDTRLGRAVALKFLPDHLSEDHLALERFQREARAASALNHPNICSIYDIDEQEGKPFMAMEFLDGETLKERVSKGPMPFEEFLETSLQIVSGLEVAHEEGILHRDLKPANLFLTTRGFAKVLDFGLAKVSSGPAESDSVDRTATMLADDLTQPGSTVGTVAYMAPEQARGEPVDARSDLFSLGTVLYELATGRRAFAGTTTALTFDAILHQTPIGPLKIRPELPEELEHIVAKALEKDPNLRYQSAAELKSDLLRLRRDASSGQTGVAVASPKARGSRLKALGLVGAAIIAFLAIAVFWTRDRPVDTSPPTASPEPTVAVLPFHNLAANEDLDYLRFAVPDEITTALSYAPALDVRPFSITRKYSAIDIDPISVGREVKARTVVTGQFSLEGNRLQVTLEAIDIDGNRLLWRDRVAVTEGDLIALRQQLSDTVRANLLPIFDQTAHVSGSAPTNSAAYEMYLQSLAMSNDTEPNREGVALLEKAVELDPGYAPAWSQLAWRYALSYAYGGGGRRDQELAIESAQTALELDPDLMAASRQLVLLHAESSRIRDAYDVARAAVDRTPESAEAHFALSYVYRYAGLLVDAAEECEAAWTGSSTNPQFRSCAVVFNRLGEFERARDFANLDEGSTYQLTQDGFAAFYSGDYARAAELWSRPETQQLRDRILQCGPTASPEQRARIVATLRQGMSILDPESQYNFARWLTYCGEHDLAIEFLRVAINKNYCAVSVFENERLFEPLRDHPEFKTLHGEAIACRERFLERRAKQPLGRD